MFLLPFVIRHSSSINLPTLRFRGLLTVISRNIHISTPHKMLPLSIEQRRPSRSAEYDQSTLSNYKDFAVLHTDLNLSVSFEKSAISGSVTFQLKKLHEGKNKSDELHLDTSYLDVQEVHIDGSKADFQIEQRKEPLGSRLVINNASCNDNFTLNIQFRTTDKCTALQWLNSKQTKGGKPYVFSQLEAIHARSLFPCFDTPSVKSTFTASIESPLPVVFSGIRIEDTSKDTNIYRFEQKVPIPAYLIGIASGDLSSAPIGPRSTVYTEPFRLKDCQWEFENDVEKFIQTAEKIIFEYEWGTYDILVNVDSYPYGGMESPNMTFATPTLIAHDRSNIDVIAHELAHSWSGNLVTNCSWNHFWLNEGWTVYLERRIIGAIHGEPTRHFSALIGWSDLQNSIDSMKDPERFSTLVQNLNDNTDPDDAFSTVPYEKGFNLLFHLETILGGKAEFDPFIRHYFKKFAKKSLDTFQFLDTLYEFYPEKKEILDSVDWETWLYKPGMPPRPHFITALADNVYQLADKWVEMAQHLKTTEDFRSEFNAIDIKDFNSNQLVLFLETLTQNDHSNKKSKDFDWAKFPVASRALLDIYQDNIVKSQNAEVVFKMFKFQIFAKLQEEYKHLADWLGTVGRMKFVRPGYRLLNSVDRRLALATFDKFKDTYHPICKALVKQDLGL
ncbi:Lap2p [Saccharomyces cerevisiae YJM987]|nr:Lap2p [Saccharomyces cerevisiae YJM993]AJT11059.1 Lap2p [Saccharomyces cerevisiae YJM972]AJT11441.1 Lap2p [Saccharomyces cerevisiae YJM975]AJT11821.1 Lap2p [Saccharomyces cerevisiae YJM978]AJT12586.1 Lap2p [Saccharomyces cerevisiae YJM984]AJT12968.1 Lap2p [Saccharomyces cerevisiae YJM987]AJT13734.1 Lap2p [Saccharomyces cerevisiae YJM996]